MTGPQFFDPRMRHGLVQAIAACLGNNLVPDGMNDKEWAAFPKIAGPFLPGQGAKVEPIESLR